MFTLRDPSTIYQIDDEIVNGSFHGRWHFSFGGYYDPAFTHFGTLRVFNDDTLSPGAIWPLHPHRDNEVVTYCAEGEFRHADDRGLGGVLKKGWVQHTTIGTGMWHSEINNLRDRPLRFIQMWFLPADHGLAPSIQQKPVEKKDRTGTFLPLVSNSEPGALRIVSDAEVFSSFLAPGSVLNHPVPPGWGAYLYVLEGGPATVNGRSVPALASVMITGESKLIVSARNETETLLVQVRMEV
jgi:redox-sensitive bicupin YhaK (pirin superfamily)